MRLRVGAIGLSMALAVSLSSRAHFVKAIEIDRVVTGDDADLKDNYEELERRSTLQWQMRSLPKIGKPK